MASAPTGSKSGRSAGTMCANHRRRQRVAVCGVCESPLCVGCVVHTAVGVKCRKCTGGAMDRNGGVQTVTNLPDPLYRDLAESYAQAGYGALRYDRRDTGDSKLAPGVPLTWNGLVADAKAGLDFLGQRRETQGQPVIV